MIKNIQYYPIKFDAASPSYTLYVLIQDDLRTADYLIEKATTTGDVIELTYFESNENAYSISTIWSFRASHPYVEKTKFKAPFAKL